MEEIILNFYNKIITVQEFMEYFNSTPELQAQFNKVFKNYPPTPEMNMVEWLNYAFKKQTGSDTQELYIWLFVKEFLLKTKKIQLCREDLVKEIIDEITKMSAFYSAEQDIEDYIIKNIIADMPIESLNKTIKMVKANLKEHFKSDGKMPNWIQSCEWPFDEMGKPLAFKKTVREGGKYQYVFYNPKTKIEVVEQFD